MTKKERGEKRAEALEVAEKLGLVRRPESFISVVYGAAAVGKTTFVAHLLEEAHRQMQIPVAYIATEPNVRLYGGLERIQKMLPPQVQCTDKRVMESVYYIDDILRLYHTLIQLVSCMDAGVIAVDSITALAIHEQARHLAATGRVDVLPIVQRVSAYANSIVQWLANAIADKHINIIIVAQERPAIPQPWHGQPTAPSFASRALHNVGAVARLYIDGKTRVIKTVVHRIADYIGRWEELDLEPLL